MENQHRHITGYRDLSQAEIDLMNRIKAQGYALQGLIEEVEGHIKRQYSATLPEFKNANELGLPKGDAQREDAAAVISAEKDTPEERARKEGEAKRLNAAGPGRWAAIARTDFQTGLMALTRAVAQPSSF